MLREVLPGLWYHMGGKKSGRVQGPMEVLLRQSVLPECVLAIADLLCSIKH